MVTSISRRTALSMLSGVAVTLSLSRAALADDCVWVQAALVGVEADLANIDAWVATDGPAYVAALRSQLSVVIAESAAGGATLEQQNTSLLIDAIGATASAILFAAGFAVAGPFAAGGLILASIGVSATLLVVKTVYAPGQVDGVEVVTMQTVGDVDRVLTGADESVAIAYRSKVGMFGKFFGFCSLTAEFYLLWNASEDRDATEMKVQELRDLAIELEGEAAALEQPGNLWAFRQESLAALRDFLQLLSSGCSPQMSLS